MSNFNQIPSEFKVFSTEPELKIRYSTGVAAKGCLLIFFIPFFFIFAGHCFGLLSGLYELLNLRFSEAIQLWSYNTNNIWSMLMFFGMLFLLGFTSWAFVWGILGVPQIHATQESLTIIYQLLGMSHKISVLATNISYFNQFLNRTGEADSWDLEIVTKQKLYATDRSYPRWFPAKLISEDGLIRMNYKTINLYGHSHHHPSEWLGKVLADFYQVEFKSTFDSNSA
ncbi:hypothetical protein H6G36_24675 [Anabaena minutissima FACHB-250]|nr:hypothetical protein [Anabaena minutissima FACHB-250]